MWKIICGMMSIMATLILVSVRFDFACIKYIVIFKRTYYKFNIQLL